MVIQQTILVIDGQSSGTHWYNFLFDFIQNFLSFFCRQPFIFVTLEPIGHFAHKVSRLQVGVVQFQIFAYLCFQYVIEFVFVGSFDGKDEFLEEILNVIFRV